MCKSLPKDSEGFVCQWETGFRLKFKGAEYLRVHKLISNVKPLPIWDMLKNGDDMDVIKKQLPEEFWQEFDNIVDSLRSKFYAILGANHVWTYTKGITLGSRKEFALKAIEDSKTNKLLSPSFLFLMYDGKNKEIFDLIWKSIRPTGNQL